MKRFKAKTMYLPALSILMVVFVMLILISISTYRNLDRDKQKAMASLSREGRSILNAIEAGARTGLSYGMKKGVLSALINETVKHRNIAYIYIIDHGHVQVQATNEKFKHPVTPWSVALDTLDDVKTRIHTVSPEIRLYELAKLFLPERKDVGDLIGGRIAAISSHSGTGGVVIVLGLEMTGFEKAHSTDIHHAFIMAAIMVALGSAALFFIFVIQNYYLVDKTLKQTQDYTRQVVANMANGLLSVSLNGAIVSYNQLALDLLELRADKIEGQDLRGIIDFDMTGVSETLAHCRSVLDHEISHPLKSGGVIPLSLSATPITNDDGICIGAVILLRDLREIKVLEAKVRRSETLAAIGELAASVAHEIRNPLSSIKGFAQFLRHSLKDRPEEQEYADVMVREIDRINRVVTDLLTYARPVTIERTQIDLSALVQHAIRLVTADAQAKGITISNALSSDLNQVVLDENQITQALLNLLLNAIQVIPDGGKISVGASRETDTNRLNLWVEDNGPGIPQADQAKVLDPFFTTRNKGTGLGLAIVSKIVENHQGEIRIHSPLVGTDRGTRISLLIP